MKPETVRVDLDARAYDILIGDDLIGRAGGLLAPLLYRPYTVVVSDETVFAAHGARLLASLADAGVACETIVLPPGEQTKSFSELEKLTGRLLDFGVERSDLVIAFGGGVIGDITGFSAAILKRGCRFAQIPTTLLAQVDSSVGGKTGVNTAQGKNLVGAFNQPTVVLADIGALDTLPPREMRAGYAEIVKYAALGDAAFFGWLEENGPALLNGDRAARAHAVKRSCQMKAAIVREDERETGARALLNLGHTFGHALEAALGYSQKLLHGEAVAAGMGMAFDFAVRENACRPADAARLKTHLRASGLPASEHDIAGAENVDAPRFLELMRHDKKVRAGALTLILARRLGEAYIAEAVDDQRLLAFLESRRALPDKP